MWLTIKGKNGIENISWTMKIKIKYEDKTVRIRYSNFDKYGNWLKSRNSYTDNVAIVIYERVIEYYE